jgi:hypothetical protein
VKPVLGMAEQDTVFLNGNGFNVFHIDGSLENCQFNNLKTICANCQRIMQKEGVRWKQGDLLPDF